MSVIWRGYDEILGRPVAIKVLAPQLAGDDSFRDRLRLEALAAARLCHPNITGVFDFGESRLSAQLSVPYVVMELNDGESVAARLTRAGPMSWHDAVAVGAEVASALATAHARGVVHRDVTPANVMLTSAGAKVVDFGISAVIGERDSAPDGSLLGTPAYLAPERLSGGRVSPATDVYALGLLLYRCLTGRLPWSPGTTTETLRAHLYTDPEPVPPIAGLPSEAGDLCLRCLAKDPADRPAADEVARALAGLVGSQAIIPPLDGEFSTEQPARTIAVDRPAEPIPARRPPNLQVAALLMYFGLPSVTALRLRAGLRIGTALRLRTALPLGGGLFAGGRRGARSRAPRLPPPAFAGSHRLQAAAATIALIVALGVSWSAAQGPAPVAPAEVAPVQVAPTRAAAVGAQPTAPRPLGCRVRYQVKRDNGDDFEALLTILNTGKQSLAGWRLTFTYPGTQRLVDRPKTVAQKGHVVLVRAAKNMRLPPGKGIVVPLRGVYRIHNSMPLAFDLNAHTCRAELLGVSIRSATDRTAAQPRKTKAETPGRTPRSASASTTRPVKTVGFSPGV